MLSHVAKKAVVFLRIILDLPDDEENILRLQVLHKLEEIKFGHRHDQIQWEINPEVTRYSYYVMYPGLL